MQRTWAVFLHDRTYLAKSPWAFLIIFYNLKIIVRKYQKLYDTIEPGRDGGEIRISPHARIKQSKQNKTKAEYWI